MAKGRWKFSSEAAAKEIFLVLCKKAKPSKTYPKWRLQQFLVNKDIRANFLRLCLEYDGTDSLTLFRKGLLFAVKAIGPSKVASDLRVNRVSLYRMLSADGNPSLRYIFRLCSYFGLNLWLVDDDFTLRRERALTRPKETEWNLEAFEEIYLKFHPPKTGLIKLGKKFGDDENSR
jgi:DNA-binding phage protein